MPIKSDTELISDSDSSDSTLEPHSPASVPTSPKKNTVRKKKTVKDVVTDEANDVKEHVKEHVNPICKKPRGRPKKSLEEKLAKKTIIREKIIYMIPDSDGNLKKVKNPELTKRDLKRIELEKQKEEKATNKTKI